MSVPSRAPAMMRPRMLPVAVSKAISMRRDRAFSSRARPGARVAARPNSQRLTPNKHSAAHAFPRARTSRAAATSAMDSHLSGRPPLLRRISWAAVPVRDIKNQSSAMAASGRIIIGQNANLSRHLAARHTVAPQPGNRKRGSQQAEFA